MIYKFDDFVLDTATQELSRDTARVHVEPQVLAVLEHLPAHRDRVVTKIELLDEVWGDRFVSETALTSRTKLARTACGDSGREQRVIATVHGRGYRFVADTVERERATGRPPAGDRGRCQRARGAVEEHFGLLDALDALGGLARTEPDTVIGSLEAAAPSWLAQLPVVLDDELAQRLERRLLVERGTPVALLVLCTARAGEGQVQQVIAASTGRGCGTELRLDPLGSEAIGDLTRARLEANTVATELTEVLTARSGRVPLFAQEVLSSWVRSGLVRVEAGRGEPVGAVGDLGDTVPASLVPLIEQPLLDLDASDLGVLEAAAVAGSTFDSAAVAAGAELAGEDTDTRLATMAGTLAHLGVVRGSTWPDGTVSTTYEFAHDLCRAVVYDRIPATRSTGSSPRTGALNATTPS